jgi:hypothetical protein
VTQISHRATSSSDLEADLNDLGARIHAMSDTHGNRKGKVVKEAIVDVLATGANAGMPGAGLVVKTTTKVVGLALRKRIDRNADEFFEYLSQALDHETPETLLFELEQRLTSPKTQDAVSDGFLDMMECVDEESKKCMALLVADYIKNADSPDAFYRRVGTILKSCSASELGAIRTTVDHLVEMILETKSRTACAIKENDGNFWVIRATAQTAGGETVQQHPSHSTAQKKPKDFKTAIRLLSQEGFGSKPEGAFGSYYTDGSDEGTVVLRMSPDQIPLFERLRTYLIPVDVEQ